MNLFDIIYTIIIGPLKLIFEVIYSLAYYMCSSPGLSIIALSLVMNFLVLPLYAKADKMQEEQNNIEKKLHKGVEHIKKTFKGDERYMMLQTYYRQNNYKPTDALKGSISLLLEIPFFMAAYAFLSNLNVLKHASFGPIADLGAPDQMLSIFGITLNVLPILMTLINIVSSYIYTKGLPAKAKAQLYVMAGLFLVLLYDSPSGLVFYWTLNNLFSLVKNIFYKLKNPKLVLSVLSSIVSVLGLLFVIIKHPFTFNQTVLVVALLLAMQLPIVLYFFKDKLKLKHTEDKPSDSKVFVISTIALALLTGLLIPTQLINSSPTEFMNTVTMENPLIYVLSSFCLALGTFVVWFNVFYNLLGGNRVKRILNYLIVIVLFVFVVDYMFFGGKSGQLSLALRFDDGLVSETTDILMNIAVVCVLIILLSVLYRFKKDVIRFVEIAAIITMIVVSSMNMFNINKTVKNYSLMLKSETNEDIGFGLSRDNENVVVIILDRAIGRFLPYIFEELPYLQEQYAGFTFYPNTLSYGRVTKSGIPALYGGYEYTPFEINKRENENLQDKVYESFKVMPYLFDDNGFDVTVTDPTLGSTPEIYEEREDIKVFNTLGNVRLKESDRLVDYRYERLKRNVFCYALVKCVPNVVQPFMYNGGAYNSIDTFNDFYTENISVGRGIMQTFIDNYAVLASLSELTDTDNKNDTFTLIYNSASHEDTLLREPDYVPDDEIDNTEYDNIHQYRNSILDEEAIELDNQHDMNHYQVNAASLIQIGKWLDSLREKGIYDNTRIIIVSDHGNYLDVLDRNDISDSIDNVSCFNPLLLYKDFNANEFTVDYSLMTNADTVKLAADGLVEEIVNPFTGNDLSLSNKNDVIYILSSGDNNNPSDKITGYDIEFGKNVYVFNGTDIYNVDNWKLAGNE